MPKRKHIRLINSKAHAGYDYLMAAFIFLSPITFGFSEFDFPCRVMYAVATILGITALVTRFEFSILPFIPLPVHFLIDLVSGVFLIASPWIFGFSEQVFKPQLVLGLSIVVVSMLSDRVLSHEVDLVLAKGRTKTKPVLKKAPRKFNWPGMKLVTDPFYLLQNKSSRKKAPLQKPGLVAKILE